MNKDKIKCDSENLEDEIIEDISFSNGDYKISSNGYVTSYCNTTPYKIFGSLNSKGYLVVNIKDKYGKYLTCYIHHLVANQFVYNDDPVNKTEIHHKDGQKTNNFYRNLQWVSCEEHQRLHKELRDKKKQEDKLNGQL